MKKNKLYTANKWNRPFFELNNIFEEGGSANQQSQSLVIQNQGSDLFNLLAGNTTSTSPSTTQQAPLTPMQRIARDKSTPGRQISVSDNGTNFRVAGQRMASEGTNPIKSITNAVTAAAGAGLGAVGNKIISDGYDAGGVGNTIADLGGAVGGVLGMIPGVGTLAGPIVAAASGIFGGLTNRAFGMKTNQKTLNNINQAIADYSSYTGATDFDDIQDITSHSLNTNAYKGGWFKGSSAARKNNALKEALDASRMFAYNNVENNINNLSNDQINNALRNFSALGGPLDTFGENNMGAIEYDFISDYLNSKKKKTDQSNIMTNLFAGVPSTMFDFGGTLQTNGADYGTGLTHIDAGLSHEMNPNDGVQMGVDSEGVPNLVEEGETVYNDYVFSNRILADDATKQLFHLPKKRDITFADISKRLEEEIKERPNDPISKAGFKAQMQTLEDQQERQKQEMEAERAKAAFEALTPEEQQAVMQQVAQQNAMAQQAALEENMGNYGGISPNPMQQEPQATQPEVLGDQTPMMAEGGHLFANGSYLWDKFWSPVNEYSKKRGNAKNKYQIDRTYKGDIKELENSEAYKAFTDYILNNATDEERLKYFRWIDDNTGRERTYTNKKGELLDGWKEKYLAARNDGLYGIQHYTPEWEATQEEAIAQEGEPRIFHALEDDEDYIQGELDPNVVGDEVRRTTLPNGDTVIYHARKAAPASPETPAVKAPEEEGPGIEPVQKADWIRYAGLFGPAVGLGMQMAGIGKPDYSDLDAAVQSAGNAHLATYKPIGNYLTYRPMDIWFEQNRMDANARATDRAIMNNAAPIGTKMAGLLASGYNSQIADGELYRKALEYNDNKRKDVAEFNRGTDQFNAEAFNRLSQFNASALNDAAGRSTNARLHAAQQKLANDAGWYNSLYGNVSGLFKGISDLGRENRETNWRNALVTAGAFGAMDEDALVKAGVAKYKKGKKSSEGGTVKRKKGKRGLTY